MSSRRSILLEEMVWPEVESALENGTRTAIVAVGSIEQHGPHLPLNMDTLDGDELSRRIAEKLGDAIAAPTIRPGCSGHHMEFPGTITVPPETLMDVIRAYCRLSEAGIDYNQDVIHAGAAETAVVLAVNEDLVRMENIESGPEGTISTARLLSEGFKTITQNGVLGDPDKATAEAGETIIQNVVDTYVDHIENERCSVYLEMLVCSVCS